MKTYITSTALKSLDAANKITRRLSTIKPPQNPVEIDLEYISLVAEAVENDEPEASLLIHAALCRLEPDNAQFQIRHANALQAQGDRRESLKAISRAAKQLPDHPEVVEQLMEAAFAVDLEHDERAEHLAPALSGLSRNPDLARRMASNFVMKGDMKSALECGRHAMGPSCKLLEIGDDAPGEYSAFLYFHENGYDIRLSKNFHPWSWLLDRLFTYRDYLQRLVETEHMRGVVWFCLGDLAEGDAVQVCFSSDSEMHNLCPDPVFVETDGYKSFKAAAARQSAPFSQRRDVAYWRGSLTGLAHTYHDIMKLPRIQLALLSQHSSLIDARLTSLNQFGPLLPTLQQILDGMDLCGDREPETSNMEYRYLIDLDGNSNSWPGLMTKLISGGVVFKLRSPFRQWYYDQLIDHDNIVLVDELFPELVEKLEWCREHHGHYARIAENGHKLAQRMNADTEYVHFRDAMIASCI